MTLTTPIRVGPITVDLITADDRIVASLRERGPFEPESLATWALMCGSAPGSTVIDIGAYTGIYTIAARKLGCHVIAFEPMATNRLRMRENCRMNGVDDKVSSEAICDEIGSGTLQTNDVPYTAGASLVRKSGQSWPVELLTIDSLHLPKVAAMKIDVERAEPMVLRGARKTLERCRPELLVEVLGEGEGNAVTKALCGLGYKHAATLDVRNWLMVPE